jgi:aconitase B
MYSIQNDVFEILIPCGMAISNYLTYTLFCHTNLLFVWKTLKIHFQHHSSIQNVANYSSHDGQQILNSVLSEIQYPL